MRRHYYAIIVVLAIIGVCSYHWARNPVDEQIEIRRLKEKNPNALALKATEGASSKQLSVSERRE